MEKKKEKDKHILITDHWGVSVFFFTTAKTKKEKRKIKTIIRRIILLGFPVVLFVLTLLNNGTMAGSINSSKWHTLKIVCAML